jgi:hypothetical protein
MKFKLKERKKNKIEIEFLNVVVFLLNFSF